VSPIPLTEELLLKCGFVLDNMNGIDHYDNYCIVRGETLPSGEIIYADFFKVYGTRNYDRQDGAKLFTIDTFSDFTFKFLHQLQNLYLVLTGEELQITL
jgi:hypothetical protein